MIRVDYVEPFLGGGGSWLGIVGEDLVPPVSWMGGKRRYAADIRALLSIRAGKPRSYLLGDSSWWGWVWPMLLDPVTGPEVSMLLRFWRGRDPRALWFWLRDIGPLGRTVEGAAQLLWLQARAASGVPVWWEGGDAVQWASTKVDRAGQSRATEPGLVQDRGWKSPTCATRKVWRATQGNAVEGRLVTTTADGQGLQDGCCKGNNVRGAGGIVDPGTIADRLDAIRRALVGSVGFIAEADAWTLTERAAPALAPTAVVLDPPYQDKTGYPCVCPRPDVLRIAETWARHGHQTVLHEAVSLRADLGAGWTDARLSRPGAAKEEWVTCYGVDVRALLPGLLRGAA